ncbi:uncharacterized protein LOC112567058 [Pomacea canaliculata]|uniref:uncharacterized protein LOC112567058 n=1 Tax=Pomacea canaliculata TaxID=400727 RepID=UPI000D730D69|nr:uncharacterized protein LOC112567058 [Pomacea canaliculata]
MQLLSSLQLTLLFILHAPRSSTPTLSGTQVDFRPIGRDGAFFVYSAHVDLSSQRSSIAVVAIVNRTQYGSGARVRCRFTMPAKNLLLSRVGQSDWATMVNGTLSILPDHHNLAFAPALVNCPLPNSPKDKRPIKVTLNLEGDNSTTSELHIQYPQPRRWKFLICFSPLHREFNDANLVVHNLELAQILGAEHAVVYNTSIGADVDKVLRYYVSTGFLEVKGWRDPPEPVHYKAQMGAINDCLLYGRNSSDFIVFMDFDEMIVPKYHKNWSEFIRDVQLNYNSSALASSQKGSLTHMNDALVTALRTPRKVNATTQRSMRRRKRSMRRRKRSMQRLGRHLQDTALHVLGQPWGLCLRQQRVPLGQCDKFNCPRLEVSQSASHHFSPEAKANCADMARPLQEHRGSPGGENHGHP